MNFKHSKPINFKLIIICIAAGIAISAAAVMIFLTVLKKNPLPTSTSSSAAGQIISSSSDAISSNEEPKEPEPEKPKLVITAPEKTSFTTTTSTFMISGSSDPTIPLTLNGADVKRDEKGYFALDLPLNVGKNTFTLTHEKETKTFTVTYRYVVIKSVMPATAQKYISNTTFGVSVTARCGSTASATFNGQTIKLIEATAEEGAEFAEFKGSFTLPNNEQNTADLKLGKIKFTATHNGVTETSYSGEIICKKSQYITETDPSVPTGGKYIDVGAGVIGEIIHFQAETFDAYSTNDWSSPINNYLPEGTVDYISPTKIYSSGGKEYTLLRYGTQVYTKFTDKPKGKEIQVIKEYVGKLPAHNEIKLASMSEEGRFTSLTFDCMWKAPFYFNIPQSYPYYSSKAQNFSINSFTASYVDIVFCYATVFEGEIAISEDNPLFKSAEIIKNPTGADHTLRLHLRKAGGFYGWDAKYNSQGQLQFEFLHPAKISTAENSYGVDLAGVTILIDAGHNGAGVDVGALGSNSYNHEAERNLNLARKLKVELEKMGATVVMTRDSEISSITYQQRIQKFKEIKPDFCISIHHNSSTSSKPKGFVAYYGTPFSKNATEFISDRTFNKAVYSEIDPLGWHYFFLARVTNCPVVLTENGFMSNAEDFRGIIDNNINIQKAIAMAEGIADYFKSIQ